jgi:hypothetical protein
VRFTSKRVMIISRRLGADWRRFRALWPALVVLGVWTGAARADDPLGRNVHFAIAPAPLANALVQFSAQSGVQIAVADADVAQLQSKGLSGDYPVRAALGVLLQGTGLTFAPIGATTVAIRAAAGGALGTSAQFPDAAFIAPSPPSAQELAGDSLFQFIVHHGSTHYLAATAASTGGLLRWRGGRPETVCPETIGLEKDYNEFVSARLRAVAAFVGAPVHLEAGCVPNVFIQFTTDPRKAYGAVLEAAAHVLGVGFPHQMERELDISGQHPIQGWYVTAGGGASVLNADPHFVGGVALAGLWPAVIPTSASGDRVGTRLVHGGGRSILAVFLMIDARKVAGDTIRSIADYLSVVALTAVQSPDHCDPLPSILDLMAASCSGREKPTAITAGDVAFLKALYYHNTGLGPTLSRDDIETNILQQFRRG